MLSHILLVMSLTSKCTTFYSLCIHILPISEGERRKRGGEGEGLYSVK